MCARSLLRTDFMLTGSSQLSWLWQECFQSEESVFNVSSKLSSGKASVTVTVGFMSNFTLVKKITTIAMIICTVIFN